MVHYYFMGTILRLARYGTSILNDTKREYLYGLGLTDHDMVHTSESRFIKISYTRNARVAAAVDQRWV